MPAGLADLTERERDVLEQLAMGRSNAEIGDALFLSEATVKTHVGRVLAKLGVRDRVQAVIVALEAGIGRTRALLALTVVVALTGIANTIVLTAMERRSEFGLLRAVGMTTRQVRAMVRYEAVVLSALGVTTGLVTGTVVAVVAIPLLPDEFVGRIEVSVGSLSLYLAAGIVLGLLAAVLPARRVAKVDILDALQPV